MVRTCWLSAPVMIVRAGCIFPIPAGTEIAPIARTTKTGNGSKIKWRNDCRLRIILCAKGKIKYGLLVDLSLCPNFSTMAFDHSVDNGKSDTRPGESTFAVQPLKRLK